MDNLKKYLENNPIPYVAFNKNNQAAAYNKAFLAFSGIGEDFLNQMPPFLGVFEMLQLFGKLEQTLDFKATIAAIEQTYTLGRTHKKIYTLPTLEVYAMTMNPLASGWMIDWQIPEHIKDQDWQRQQREVFNETSDGIILANKSGDITLINNKAHALMGIHAHTDTLKDVDQILSQQYPSQKITLEKVFTIRHNQKETLKEEGKEDVTLHLSPMENGGTMLILQQEKKYIDPWQWEKEMTLLKTSIVEDVINYYSTGIETISDISGVLTHAYAESMTGRIKNHVETINTQATRLHGSIENLMALLPTTKPVILEDVHVDVMFTQILNTLEKRTTQKRIHIKYTMIGDDGWIKTDKQRLQQSLHALLRHMIEQNEPHQEIHIKSGKHTVIIEDSCKKPLLHGSGQSPEIYFIERSMKTLGITYKVREGKYKQRTITLTWTP